MPAVGRDILSAVAGVDVELEEIESIEVLSWTSPWCFDRVHDSGPTRRVSSSTFCAPQRVMGGAPQAKLQPSPIQLQPRPSKCHY